MTDPTLEDALRIALLPYLLPRVATTAAKVCAEAVETWFESAWERDLLVDWTQK